MLTLVHCTWLSQWTAHCHTLSLTITPYHSLSLTIAHCHSLSLTITHYHSLSLTITHYHSLSLPITPYHSLSLTITHYHSLSLTATHYHLLQLASTHTHLHTNTHLIHTPHILFYLYLDPGVLRSSLYSVDENQRVYRLQVSDASVCPVYVCPINVICATCSQSVNQSVSQSAADHLLTYRFIYPHIISFTHISFHLLTYRVSCSYYDAGQCRCSLRLWHSCGSKQAMLGAGVATNLTQPNGYGYGGYGDMCEIVSWVLVLVRVYVWMHFQRYIAVHHVALAYVHTYLRTTATTPSVYICMYLHGYH